MKLLLLSILIFLFSSTIIAQDCQSGANSFLPNPDPTKCNTFYQCSNGVPVLQHCPWPLVFHASVNGCDKALPGDCISPDPYCPTDGVHSTLNGDCSKFVLCSWGKPTLMSCAPGTVFNPKGYCDWPANVDCTTHVCYQHKDWAYTVFGKADGASCSPAEYWTSKRYIYDVTGKTFVYCWGPEPVLAYCCTGSHFLPGFSGLCQLD